MIVSNCSRCITWYLTFTSYKSTFLFTSSSRLEHWVWGTMERFSVFSWNTMGWWRGSCPISSTHLFQWSVCLSGCVFSRVPDVRSTWNRGDKTDRRSGCWKNTASSQPVSENFYLLGDMKLLKFDMHSECMNVDELYLKY